MHAGFHKTGTSFVQQMLRAGASALSPHLRLFTRPRMVALCEATRRYDAAPGPLNLTLVAHELAALLEPLDLSDPRPVLLSSEDLSGHIPGRRGRLGYPNAAPLMNTLADTARAAGFDPVLAFSTRAPEAWMRSCHAQHLRVTRMRQNAERYAREQRAHADLTAIAATIARIVAPAPLHVLPLEDSRGLPQGPLTPLLDLARVPLATRAVLPDLPHANAAPPADVLDQLLALNRSDLPRDLLQSRKRALIRRARQG